MTGKPTYRDDAFDAVAEEYDACFTHSLIGWAQRQAVWNTINRVFRPCQRILEINCGTGVDALHLAERGCRVVACDASVKMLKIALRRVEASPCSYRVVLRHLPIEEIGQLESEGPYDGLLSNFAGLNCVEDLRNAARTLARLIVPGGRAVICMFGGVCLWETVWYMLRGDTQRAFRRFRGEVVASLAPDHNVVIRYPSVGAIGRDFAPHFRLVQWKGIGIAVPPSYLEPWAARLPWCLEIAARMDAFLGRCPGLRALGDHVVLVLERVDA